MRSARLNGFFAIVVHQLKGANLFSQVLRQKIFLGIIYFDLRRMHFHCIFFLASLDIIH
jgi:hypothetical protein